MATETALWWSLLCTVGLFNVVAWATCARRLHRSASELHAPIWAATRLQMLLSAGYVAGCAYRSAFPVFDVQRLVLVDSWLSSVVVGRSVATIAELCFAAQWALLLRALAHQHDSRAALHVSRIVVPLIVVAETCSWHAVLTTSNLGHVFEETIWGLCAALLVASFIIVWPLARRESRPLLAAATLIGLGYVIYMFEVDVPMYWARWVLDESQGRQYLSIAQGLADTSGRWIVSHSWDHWRTEVVWMTLYFSVAVWLSIGLMHLPRRLHADTVRGQALHAERMVET